MLILLNAAHSVHVHKPAVAGLCIGRQFS